MSGIQRRSADVMEIGDTDTGIQRRHDPERTKEIQDYIRVGFPHAVFRPQDRAKAEYADSKMPGWLPTAIVVNIFHPDFPDERKGRRVAEGDHIRIRDSEGMAATVLLPDEFDNLSWRPKELFPMEVIDGQHRLWAFDDPGRFGGYELPVVAFYGLDVTWQAYLFYTINIRPVKINASLAFDLYPLLRTEDCLSMTKGHLCTGRLVLKRSYGHCMLTLKVLGTTISICWETRARGWSGKLLGLGRCWPLTSDQFLDSGHPLGAYSVRQALTATKPSIGMVHSKSHSSYILDGNSRTK